MEDFTDQLRAHWHEEVDRQLRSAELSIHTCPALPSL